MAEGKASLSDIAPELPEDGTDAMAKEEWTLAFSIKKTKPQLQNERYHLQTSIIRDEHHREGWCLSWAFCPS